VSEQTSGEDFDNAVFVLADEPEEEGGLPITLQEFRLCAPEPMRLMVLVHWRAREQDGEPCSTESIWSKLAEMGVHGSDGETPVRLDEVRQAVEFLLSQGLVTSTSGGER
jgi:hypothetical protein